jgi:hypothetical protein
MSNKFKYKYLNKYIIYKNLFTGDKTGLIIDYDKVMEIFSSDDFMSFIKKELIEKL